jgi:6-pyruvoyltetrahydropterin/6-carboxytetrahydropterin synthase
MNHEGGCAYLHGHNWVALVTITSPDLDPVGRVIDFSKLKEIVGKWIDDNWDHAFILNGSDTKVKEAIAPFSRIYELGAGENPSSENLSAHLYNKLTEILPAPLQVKSIELHETSNCWSTYPEKTPQFT